jgi:hypothetical protein
MEDIIRYVCDATASRVMKGNCSGAVGRGFSCELISDKENQLVTYRERGNYNCSQRSLSDDFTEKVCYKL